MKVRLQKGYKSIYTIEDLEIAKRVISEQKEDTETPSGWAEYAVNEALRDTGDYLDRIIEANATTAKNRRIWNAYFEDSQHMDVWIEGIARTEKGFLVFGAYLTDIWQTGAIRYKDSMWIKHYTEAR